MESFRIRPEATKAAILYVLKNLNGQCDTHKLSKILYFADQKHMVKWGRPITGETYAKMEYGPVPSKTYDSIKKKDDKPKVENPLYEILKDSIEVIPKYEVKAVEDPDLLDLSRSDIDLLNESIAENKDLTFDELVKKSHDAAWDVCDEYGLHFMPPIAIAMAGGASEEMIGYIREKMEVQKDFEPFLK